ncbi:MAG: ribonuclease P protein component [Clostridia bacterium]
MRAFPISFPNFLRRDDGKDLQHQNRLGPNRQFSYVYRRGKRASCKDLTLLYVRNNQKRIGFSVSKKVGVAVVRNRTKRRLRECIRPLLPEMKNGLYVFVARPSAAECTFLELRAQVKALLKKLETAKPSGDGMGAKRT